MARPKAQPETCTIPGCERPTHAREWCKLHYNRWARTGTTDYSGNHSNGPCIIDGCDKPRRGRDLCKTHWMAWYRRQQQEAAQEAAEEVEAAPVAAPAELSAFLAARRARLNRPRRIA